MSTLRYEIHIPDIEDGPIQVERDPQVAGKLFELCAAHMKLFYPQLQGASMTASDDGRYLTVEGVIYDTPPSIGELPEDTAFPPGYFNPENAPTPPEGTIPTTTDTPELN